MTKVKEIPFPLPNPALPDADWADCWQAKIDIPFENAREAGEAIIRAFPVWTYPALVLRQILVTPFGLKGGKMASEGKDRIGIFPVVSQTAEEIVAGIDDKHLDFRIVIALHTERQRQAQTVSMATLIHRHNRLGRTYLAVVIPFHRAIIRSAMRRMASNRMTTD